MLDSGSEMLTLVSVATRSIATSLGWDASPSQVTPSIFIPSINYDVTLTVRRYPLAPGWREAL